MRHWRRGARVRCRHDRIKAWRTHGEVDAVSPGSTYRNLGSEVREADLRANVPQAGNADHAGAVRRRADRMAGAVAGRGDDDGALRSHLRDRVDVRLAACPGAAEAHVDDPRLVDVRRHVGHREPRRPEHAGDDVGVEAAALAEHPHRKDLDVAPDARDALAVVGERTDQAGGLGAVPGARRSDIGRLAAALVHVCLQDEVARVRGVRIAAVAIVRGREGAVVDVDADHVVAGQQVAAEVLVIEADAGVEHRDDDRRAPGREVPRALRVDRRRRSVRCGGGGRRCRRPGRLQVPLPDERAAGRRRRRVVVGARDIERIVRHREPMTPHVGHRVLDVAFGRDALRELFRAHAAREHHVAAIVDTGTGRERDAQALAEGLSLARMLRVRRLDALSQQRRVGLELDDHPRRHAGARGRRRNGLGKRRAQRQRREEHGENQAQGQGRSAHRNISGVTRGAKG